MDKITLTLKRDTAQGIIYILEDYIDDLYEELEVYKGRIREKRINNYIEKCKNCLNELEAFMPKDKLDCEQEVKEE